MPSEPRTGPQLYHGGANAPAEAAIAPAQAWGLLAVGVGAIYGIQITLAVIGLGGLVASAVSDTCCIAFFWWYARHRRLGARGLGFARVGGLWYVAAVLVGASAWYVNLVIVTVLHVPEGPKDMLQGLIEDPPLPSTIAGLAVLPAFAEEIMFRGVLARALGRTRPAWQAILMSSLAFGCYHLLPAQAAATFLLGCLLSFVTLRSRSIVPAIVVHVVNNAVAIVITRGDLLARGTWMGNHPAVMLATTTTLLLAGIALAIEAPRRTEATA